VIRKFIAKEAARNFEQAICLPSRGLETPSGGQREPPCPKSFGDGGPGEGAFFKTALPPENHSPESALELHGTIGTEVAAITVGTPGREVNMPPS